MKSHIPTLLGSCNKCFDVCQISGFYCPLGSPTPVPCPKGTYGPTADAMSIHSCLNCPPHHYCPRPGLPAILPCGPGAQQHLAGQDTCICKGEGQSFQVSKFFFFKIVPIPAACVCLLVCLCDCVFLVFISTLAPPIVTHLRTCLVNSPFVL